MKGSTKAMRYARGGALWIWACSAISVLIVAGAMAGGHPLTDREARVIEAASAVSSQLLVHIEGELWLQPLAVYPAAILLKTGLSPEAAIRLPSAIAGVLTVWLTFLLANRVMGLRAAVLAAVLLLLVPAFVVHARTGGADLMIMPPLLLWLLSVLDHVERPRPWLPIAGGAALSLSLYTQPAGVLAVPVYFLLGSIVWGQAVRTVAYGRESSNVRNSTHGLTPTLAAAAVGVALGSLPFVIWFLQYPESYLDTFGRWAVHLAHVRTPWHGLIAFTNWDVMSRRASAYWHYLNPTFLFTRGEMFNPVLALLVPVGVWASWGSMTLAQRLVVASFLAAPVPAVLLDVPRSAALALPLAVFGALLAARGAETAVRRLVHFLNSQRSRYERA